MNYDDLVAAGAAIIASTDQRERAKLFDDCLEYFCEQEESQDNQ